MTVHEPYETFDKAMKSRIGLALEFDKLRAERNGTTTALADAVWFIIGQEDRMWQVLRHLPDKLPAEDGAWTYELDYEDKADIMERAPIIPHIDPVGRPSIAAHMTNMLVEHHDESHTLCRAVWVKDRYWFIDDQFTPLFRHMRKIWFTPYDDKAGVLWGYVKSEVRFGAMPMKPGSIDDTGLRPFQEPAVTTP